MPATVPLKNAGLSRLLITDLRTSCGCTSARASAKEFGFCEQGHLAVEVDTQVGSQTVFVMVKTNDPSRSAVTIPIGYEGEKRL